MSEKDSKKMEPGNDRPEYTPPIIKTYTSDELLEEIGPAQACSPSPCGSECSSPTTTAPGDGWDSDSACGVSPGGGEKNR